MSDALDDRIRLYRDLFGEAGAKGEDHVRELKRRLALSDLFYLLVSVLKRKDMIHPWVMARCDEVQASPDGNLDLWAREHFKSSIITFGLTVQDILRDPETTVGIFSHTRPMAKDFLRPIKNEFERNEELKGLFPDVLYADPHKHSPKWSEDDGITVIRKGNPKERTVEAWGLIDGMPTGKHFRVLIYDDVIDKKAVTNPEMITKATVAWEHSLALGAVGGAVRYIGTRYHTNDTYAEMMRRGAAVPRVYPATADGTMDGEPVLMSRAELAKRRRNWGAYTYAAQMLQDPTADKKQGFLADWLRYADSDGAGMNKYLICDPASEKKKDSDYTSMGVIGLGADHNYYLLDAIRDRLNLKERADALFSLHRRWRPNGVGYEKYGMQCDLEYIKERQDATNYRFQVIPLGGQMAKNDRIRRMIPIFEDGRFYLPEKLLKTDYEGRLVDLVQAFIEEEFKAFPVGLHDDMFDMIARIEDPELNAIWPKSAVPREEQDRYARKRSKPRPQSWMVA